MELRFCFCTENKHSSTKKKKKNCKWDDVDVQFCEHRVIWRNNWKLLIMFQLILTKFS